MRKYNTKTGLLSILVFTILTISSSANAEGYTYGCDVDEITGKKSGWVSSPKAKIDRSREIYSVLRLGQSKDSLWIYMYFDYLNLNNRDGNYAKLISVFKNGGEPTTNKYSIHNSKWLFVPTSHVLLVDMKKYSRFVIRLPYYSRGDINFTYNLIGFTSALNKMRAKCGFKPTQTELDLQEGN